MDLPRIRTDQPVRPPANPHEPPLQPGAQAPARMAGRGVPMPSERTNAGVRVPLAAGAQRASQGDAAGPAGAAAAWPPAYTLPQLPDFYVSTNERGVFEEWGSGHKVVFRHGRAYTVCRDPDDATWRLVKPHDRSRLGPRIRLDAGGAWQIDDHARRRRATGEVGGAARPAGVASASNPVPAWLLPVTPADRVAEYLLRFPGQDSDALAAALGVTREQKEQIASNVEEATRTWRELSQSGRQFRPSVIVAPLTERERQYVLKWSNEVPSESLAKAMLTSKDVIDAFLSETGRPSLHLPVRSPAPGQEVPARALAEWLQTIDADLAEGHRTLRFSIGDEAAAWVDRLRGKLSPRNIALMMKLPDTVLDAHRRAVREAAAGPPALPVPQVPRQPEACSQATQPAPRAGPSRQPGPLDDGQQAIVLELRNWGLSPATIAAYVGKSLVTVEAFLRERPR